MNTDEYRHLRPQLVKYLHTYYPHGPGTIPSNLFQNPPSELEEIISNWQTNPYTLPTGFSPHGNT